MQHSLGLLSIYVFFFAHLLDSLRDLHIFAKFCNSLVHGSEGNADRELQPVLLGFIIALEECLRTSRTFNVSSVFLRDIIPRIRFCSTRSLSTSNRSSAWMWTCGRGSAIAVCGSIATQRTSVQSVQLIGALAHDTTRCPSSKPTKPKMLDGRTTGLDGTQNISHGNWINPKHNRDRNQEAVSRAQKATNQMRKHPKVQPARAKARKGRRARARAVEKRTRSPR